MMGGASKGLKTFARSFLQSLFNNDLSDRILRKLSINLSHNKHRCSSWRNSHSHFDGSGSEVLGLHVASCLAVVLRHAISDQVFIYGHYLTLAMPQETSEGDGRGVICTQHSSVIFNYYLKQAFSI